MKVPDYIVKNGIYEIVLVIADYVRVYFQTPGTFLTAPMLYYYDLNDRRRKASC